MTPERDQADLFALTLELLGREGADADLVRLLAECPRRRDRLAQAADRDLAVAFGGIDREAGVDPALDLAHVGKGQRRRRAPAAARRSPGRSAPRAGGGRRCSAGTRAGRRNRRAAGSAASAPARGRCRCRARSRGRRRAVGCSGRPSARSASAAIRSGSTSSPTTVNPRLARWMATRPVPQPRSRTAPSASARQLLPERQVGGVGAALDVVPDRHRAHCQNSLARPRPASSLRSSSRAV